MNTDTQQSLCNKKHNTISLVPAMPITLNSKQLSRLLSSGLLLASVALSACGWVDSTGRSGSDSNDTDFSVSPANNGVQATGPITELPGTTVIQISEQATERVIPDSRLLGAQDYTWTPASRGNPILDCNALGDFNTQLASNNLGAACTVPGNCNLGMENVVNEFGQQAFDVTTPQLKSPAAAGYRLSGFFADGSTFTEYYAFCLIAINEAPIAVDDQFTVVRGETLRVNGNDLITLLSNDSDDTDTSNRTFEINTTPAQAPRLSSNFRLRNDGGFVYTPIPENNAGIAVDSFIYELTDGLQVSTATAVIRIVNSNTQPDQLAQIPNLSVVSGQVISTDNPSFDLSAYFSDADGDSLRFSSLPGSLPQSGNLQLSPDGQLSGTVTDEDVGDYNVTVVVFDGTNTLTDTFTLSVAANASSLQNQLPVITPVQMQVVELGERINFSVNANDADGDTLSYSLSAATADFLSIDSNDGTLRGLANQTGLFPITVIVSDSQSSTSMTFLIQIVNANNRAPLVDDIANAVFNQAFSYDVSVFFIDPDNDQLSFTAINLPAGVSISSNGVISGSPSPANAGPHFIQVTANDGNLIVTDGFLLTLQP